MKRKYKTCSAASAKTQVRYVGEKLPLYAKGNVVGVQLGNDASYFGTDLMGSVRSVTDGYGSVKDLREYDVFGNPLETCGYSNGLEYGYAGKPYDAVTEMYNYGFRDYSPATARFTTLDPVRDGTNWFSYVANDPVNFVDLWGLMASDAKKGVNPVVATPTVTVANEYDGDNLVKVIEKNEYGQYRKSTYINEVEYTYEAGLLKFIEYRVGENKRIDVRTGITKYDNNGNIMQLRRLTDYSKDKVYEYIYDFSDYDEHGNWHKYVCYCDGAFYGTATRDIEYW